MGRVIDSSLEALALRLGSIPATPPPRRVLMCPPDDFDVLDAKNPYMAAHIGQVDRQLASEQWLALQEATK